MVKPYDEIGSIKPFDDIPVLEPPADFGLVSEILLQKPVQLLDSDQSLKRDVLEMDLLHSRVGLGPEMFEPSRELGVVDLLRLETKKEVTTMQDLGQAIKEIPKDLSVGSVALTASAFDFLKMSGVNLSALPMLFPEMIEAFEPTDPKKEAEKEEEFQKMLEAFPIMDRLFRPDMGPGLSAAMSGAILKAPGVAGALLRGEAARQASKLPQVSFADQPITYLTRKVVQSGVPSVGASLGAGILTGNPVVALAVLGSTSAGGEFQEQLEAGATPLKASGIAGLVGAIEIATESLVIPKALKGITKGIPLGDALWMIGENGGQEAVAGFSQTFLSVFGKELEKGVPVEEAAKTAFYAGAKEVPSSAFVGMAVGTGMGGTGVLVDKLTHKGIDARARQDEAFSQEIEFETVEEAVAFTEQAEEQIKKDLGFLSDEGVEDITVDVIRDEETVVVRVREAEATEEDFAEIEEAKEPPAEEIEDALEATVPEGPKVMRHAEVTDTLRRVVKSHRKAQAERIRKELEHDPVFEQQEEMVAQLDALVPVGKVWIPKTFKGEVKHAVEGNPILRTLITTDPKKGKHFDEIIEESGREMEVGEFLELLSAAASRRRKIGGVSKGILDAMTASDDPIARILAMQHVMLNQGHSIQSINQETADIASEYEGLDPAEIGLLLDEATAPDGMIIPEVEKDLTPLKRAPGLTKAELEVIKRRGQQGLLRGAQKAGKEVGFKVGRIAGIQEGQARGAAKLKEARKTWRRRLQKEKKRAKAKLQKARERFDAKLRESRERARASLDRLRGVKKLSEQNRKDLREMVKAFVPDPKLKGQLMGSLAGVKNVTDLQKVKFVEKMRKAIDVAERRVLVNEAKAILKSVKPKDMAPAYREAVEQLQALFAPEAMKEETAELKLQLLSYAQQALEQAEALNPYSVSAIEAKAMVERLETQLKKTPLADVSNIDLQDLIDLLSSLDAMNQQDDAILSQKHDKVISDRQEKIRKQRVSRAKITKNFQTRFGRGLERFFGVTHGNLESISANMSKGVAGNYKAWSEQNNALVEFVYDVIDDGIDKQYRQGEASRQLVRSLITQYNIDPMDVAHRKVTATMKGVEVEFSISEIMSIFMHTRNDYNLQILTRQGMDRFDKGETERIRGFDRESVDGLIGQLSSNEKAFARGIGRWVMDGLNATALNETSVLMENRMIADVVNYWSAKRNVTLSERGKQPTPMQSLLEGMGLLKERTGQGNALVLRGFFETVYETNKSVAAYTGLAPALRDVKATALTGQMKDEFDEAGWNKEYKAITDIVRRVEENSQEMGSQEENRWLGLSAWLRSNFAKSTFGLHPKLWARQQISQLLVGAYVDVKYLKAMKGVPRGDIIDRISALSPQIKQRFESHRYDREIGDAVMDNEFLDYLTGDGSWERFKQNVTNKDVKGSINSAQSLFLSGMKYFDQNAIVDLFRVAEAELQGERPDMIIHSDEYNQALKNRFEWLVRHTQPMWHVKDRSLLGSTQNEGLKWMTMFMSQREQLVRMVSSATMQYINNPKSEAATQELQKVMGFVGTNVALISAYNILFAIGVGGKDEEDIIKDLTVEMISSTLGTVFFGRALTEAVRKFAGIVDGKYVKVDLNVGPLGLFEDAVSGTAVFAAGIKALIEGDPKASEYLLGGFLSFGETVWRVNGLPWVGPRQLTQRLWRDDKKSKKKQYKNL